MRLSSIVIDSQEIAHGHAWKFPKNYRTIVRSLLRYGVDYQPHGYAGKIGVERKSLPDYASCIGSRWKEFKRRQLSKLRQIRHGIIIVEGLHIDRRRHSLVDDRSLISRSMGVNSIGVPVFFAGSVELAEFACLEFFKWSIRAIEDDANDQILA